MARQKSEITLMTERIGLLKAQAEELAATNRKVREPELKPLLNKVRELRRIDDPRLRLLLLELRHLMARRAAKREEAAFSRFVLRNSQLTLGLSPEEAAAPAQDMTPLFESVPASISVLTSAPIEG